MSNDIASLSNLRDIVVPEAPSLWPLAPGAWLLLTIVVLFVVIIVLQYRASRQRNAYRRAGVALLTQATNNHDVAVALKRVALAVYPREQVASLYGNDWLTFLNSSCQRCDFTDTDVTASSDGISQAYVSMARHWILHHRVMQVTSMAEDSA